MRVVLDTNVLGRLCHPKNSKNKEFAQSMVTILDSGKVEIYLPEIADYELRREFLRKIKTDSSWQKAVARLDKLKNTLSYIAVDTDIFLEAAENWAVAKSTGRKTGDDKALDGDSILAAQASSVNGLVVTENERHLSIFGTVLKPDDFIQQAQKLLESN